METKLTRMEEELLRYLNLHTAMIDYIVCSCEENKAMLKNKPVTWDDKNGWIIVKPIFAKKNKGKYRTVSKKIKI